jgi:hypothetical protein
MAFKVSQSKVKLWRRCHHAYHLKHVEKLRPKRVSRPLTFGRIVHEMFEAIAEGDDPLDILDAINLKDAKLFQKERDAYGDIITDIRVIMQEYIAHHEEDPLRYVRINKKRAEHSFEVNITNSIVLTGKVDGIVKRKGLTLLLEHKTFNRLPSEDDRWRNVQSATYLTIADKLGWPQLDGTLWDYIHSKPPTRPQMLKNGSLSQRVIATLPSVVKDVLKENGLRREDYADFIKQAERNRKRYFIRHVSPIKPSVCKEVFNDLVATARDIEAGHGEKKDRNIDRHCSYCDYEPLCRAAMQGSDVDYIRKKDYVIHEKPDEEKLVAEAE